MKNIKLTGRIVFDPKDKTNKHKDQSSWKKMAMIVFDGDITQYYSWFLEKRYGIILNTPLRGAHISFINDSFKDMKINGEGNSYESLTLDKWDALKKKWDGKKIEVELDVDVRSDGKHWWLNIPQDKRELIHEIRSEIGLGRPYWGLHLSLGYANEKKIEHSRYILKCINKFGGSYAI